MQADVKTQKILEIRNLKTAFFFGPSQVPVIRGIDLGLERGRITALVGESGCGKTMTALSVLRLVPFPGRIVAGSVYFEGRDLLSLSEKQMQKIRGRDISLIFQEPGLALNPLFSIGNQIGEVLKIHRKDVKNIKAETLRLLDQVHIPDPTNKIRSYPHQLSGGMQQRALIAMAIACRPKLLIADEPTTALDVTIQAQILLLLQKLTHQLDMSVLLITHDLGVVSEIADYVSIMYAGRIVERAHVTDLFKNPLHPYTRGLLESIPRLAEQDKRLSSIPGSVPDLANLPSGCSFHPRCFKAADKCREKEPELREIAKGHWIACCMI